VITTLEDRTTDISVTTMLNNYQVTHVETLFLLVIIIPNLNSFIQENDSCVIFTNYQVYCGRFMNK
jgi:hypothetical protein